MSMNQKEQTKITETSTPILSVDESLTTEERLTDNAVQNILPARYLVDGETPDGMFRRVADNVATAEYLHENGESADEAFSEWSEEFYELMSTLRFMPNSPTLMNAGDTLQQLSACISGDTPIYTSDGLKRMDSVQEGDEVLTHTGEFKKVTSHWSNGVRETLEVKRGSSRGSNYSVTATPDHEFRTADGDWKALEEIDTAMQPTASPNVDVPDSFDLTQYTAVMGKDKPVVSDGGTIRVENTDDPRTGEYDKQYSSVVASVQNSDTLAYIAGAFLAEGDVDSSDVRFTIGSDEEDFEERIVDGLTTLFDVHVAVTESSHGNWKTISASSPFIADFFLTQFGTGSTEKRIPNWVFATDDSYQQAVLEGILDGDGHETENGGKLTLANPTLAYESSLLARNLGYDVNFTLDAANKLSKNPTSRVRISKDDGKTYMDTITTRTSGECEVFDMEVEGDHSFVAGDFVVHNCFVLEVGDSMAEADETGRESILDSAKHAGQIFKSGGGVGYTFGFLRPKGAHIESTDSETSGPMQFMKLFDEVCNTVKQGGKRRGAQMAIMPVTHPDIGRFVCAKRQEGEYSNFNISVGLTDEFIDAVQDDGLYTFKDPQSQHEDNFEFVQATKNFFSVSQADAPQATVDENIWRDYADSIDAWDWENEETVSFRDKWLSHFQLAENEGNLDVGEEMALPARFIWDMMIDGAWRNGEPGLFYLDETNREHSFDTDEHPEYEIHATNPCFTGDTLISTSNGLKRADELYESGTAVDVTVDSRLSDERTKEASSVYVTGKKDVYKLTTSEGYEIRVTADHKFKTDSGWVEAQNLESGDTVHIVDREGQFGSHGTEELGASMGWLVGDGHIHHGDNAAVLNFYDEDRTISGQFSEFVNEEVRPAMNGQHEVGVKQIRSNEQRIKSTRLYELADEMGLVSDKLQVPDTIMGASSDMASGFLRALFTADGHIENTDKSKAVVLSSKSESMLKDVQRLLLNFGIYSTIYTNRKDAGGTEIKGEVYNREALHGLHITKESLEVYQESIGFYRDDKSEQLGALLDSYTRGPYLREFEATVESIESDGHETVYDLTEPETHSLVGNGFVIHNCAEQPLNNYEACNLGHINLSLMVRDDAEDYGEWREKQDFDYYTEDAAVVDYINQSLDYDELDRVIEGGTRFLDNVVDMSDFPLDQIDDTVGSMRKIGLGVMGWAQMLYQFGIPYGSDESYAAAKHVMSYIDAQATRQSHELAKERGSFPAWEDSKYCNPTDYSEWFETHAHVAPSEHEDGYEMRNHNVTTVAPTGTTSMIADTSGGIEPVYNVAYKKNVGNDIQGAEKLVEFDSYFLRALEHNDINVADVKEEAAQKMDENSFESVRDLETVPDSLAEVFVTTNDLSSRQHGLMQRAFQHTVDSGISKTVNLPNEANRADVHEAYMLALSDDELGSPIKGLTVYRDGSRNEQVLSTGEETKASLEDAKDKLEQAGVDVGEIDE